jgi:hypothetical protein
MFERPEQDVAIVVVVVVVVVVTQTLRRSV